MKAHAAEGISAEINVVDCKACISLKLSQLACPGDERDTLAKRALELLTEAGPNGLSKNGLLVRANNIPTKGKLIVGLTSLV